MEDSNADKRRLRSQRRAEAKATYKDLLAKTRSVGRDECPKKVQQVITDGLSKSDQLYGVIKKNLEGTLADSKLVRHVVNLGSETAKRINVTSRSFELKKVIVGVLRQVREEYGLNHTDQDIYDYVIDNHVDTFLKGAPTFEYFYGALKAEDLQIKERKRRQRESTQESQALTAKERNVETEVEQDTTPKEVEYIAEQVKRLCRRNPRGYPFLKALVDRDSFSKTVENIFHTAFLVKEGQICLEMTDEGPVIKTNDSSSSQNGDSQTASADAGQAILSLTMADYRKWLG